jgi:hypothetical protein
MIGQLVAGSVGSLAACTHRCDYCAVEVNSVIVLWVTLGPLKSSRADLWLKITNLLGDHFRFRPGKATNCIKRSRPLVGNLHSLPNDSPVKADNLAGYRASGAFD